MINTTPKPGSRLRLSVMISDEEHNQGTPMLQSEALKGGAEDVIRKIVDDCCTNCRNEAMRVTIYDLDVVVFSKQEYAEIINDAYQQGLYAGSMRARGWEMIEIAPMDSRLALSVMKLVKIDIVGNQVAYINPLTVCRIYQADAEWCCLIFSNGSQVMIKAQVDELARALNHP